MKGAQPQPIGTLADGRALILPDDAVTQGFAILARRRSGKSTLAGVMEETFCARGDPWTCIDPVSAHWGIKYRDRHGQPGAASGYDVLVVGGPYGDVALPVGPEAGAALAQIIVETDISCIIDLGEEKAMRQRQLFVASFANELLHLNATPRHIFFEEAHEFVPQQLEFDGQKEARAAVSRLIRQGGGKGIGFTLISQRNAEVAKSVLEQIDNLFAMRMFGPNDLKAVEGWLHHNVADKEQRTAILQTLPSLQPGDAWLCSPDWMHDVTRLRVRERMTYHAGRTPKRGERASAPKPVELPQVIERFQRAAQQRHLAVQQQRDLKAENARLQKELAAAVAKRAQPAATPPAPPDASVIDRRVAAAVAARDREHVAALRAASSYQDKLEPLVKDCAGSLEDIAQRMRTALNGAAPRRGADRATVVTTPKPSRRELVAERPSPVRSNAPADTTLPAGALRMLRELASRHPLTWTQAQLGGLTAFSYKGGTFRTYRGLLKRLGYIEVSGREIAATEAGLAAAGEVPEAPTDHEAAMAMWSTKLPAGAYRMLQIVAAAVAEGVGQDELAEQSGFERAGGTFRTYRGMLKRNGLIAIAGEHVLACDVLWPEGPL